MLTSMEEAFKKSGLVSESEINEREKKRIQALKDIEERKKKEELRKHEEARDQQREYEKKLEPFEKMWREERGQKFVVHLIFAYTPFEVAYYPFEDSEFKGEKKCCICGQKLISKGFLFANIDQLTGYSLDMLKKRLKDEVLNPRKEFVEKFGDVVIGVISPESSAAFCPDCHLNFCKWIEYKLMMNDKKVNGIIQRKMLEQVLTKEQLVEFDEIRRTGDRMRLGKFLDGITDSRIRAKISIATTRI